MVNLNNLKAILVTCLLLLGCSKELMISNPNRPVVTPSKLELRGSSIDFTVKTQVQQGALSPTAVYRLVPRFSYKEEIVNLEAIQFSGSKRQQEVIKDYSIPYQSGMEDGKLEILGSFSDTKTGENAAYRLPLTTVNGVITTALLLDETYEPAFSTLTPYYYEKDTLKLDFEFALGGAEILENKQNVVLGAILDSMMQSDRIILGSRVIGTHSPVGSDEVNRRLSEKRATQVKGVYDKLLLKHDAKETDQVDLKFNIEFNSWDIFLEKLEETNFSSRSKERVANIIAANSDYDHIKSSLLSLPDIGAISRKVFPQLQMSRLEIVFGRTITSMSHLSQVIDAILSSSDMGKMTQLEVLSVAQLESDAQRRLSVYEKVVEQDSSSELYNDWAATYLASYHLWNQSRRGQHLAKVFQFLRKSVELRPSTQSYINLGIANAIAGQHELAKDNFTKAENTLGDQIHLHVKNALYLSKGVSELKIGDYDKAVQSFMTTEISTDVSLYNHGLAYLLSNQLNSSLVALDSAMNRGYDSARLLYTKAIVTNRANNRNLTTKFLAETFRLNPRYNDFFHRDHEFDNINKVLFPRYADSLKRPVQDFKKREFQLSSQDWQ